MGEGASMGIASRDDGGAAARDSRGALDIHAAGRLIGRTLADIYREDLQCAGLGSGRHSFTFELPPGVAASDITVRRSIAAVALPFAEVTGERRRAA
jgi:hypothetical protein